jgi:cytochrome c oxidase assembly protein subunit 11
MVTQAQSNLVMLRKLLIVAVAMFGFGFALVPFYQKICEVTGINNVI